MNDTMLEPGTYSHGTLRSGDMLDMFDTIGTITDCSWCREQVKATSEEFDYIEQAEKCDCGSCNSFADKWREGVNDDINYLFDHVEEHHTPDGFYFGSIEGDASDFGVWALDDEMSA